MLWNTKGLGLDRKYCDVHKKEKAPWRREENEIQAKSEIYLVDKANNGGSRLQEFGLDTFLLKHSIANA